MTAVGAGAGNGGKRSGAGRDRGSGACLSPVSAAGVGLGVAGASVRKSTPLSPTPEVGRSISEPAGVGVGVPSHRPASAPQTTTTPAALPPGGGSSLHKRFNVTSDYESSDSPGSSDHSDNVPGTADDSLPPRGLEALPPREPGAPLPGTAARLAAASASTAPSTQQVSSEKVSNSSRFKNFSYISQTLQNAWGGVSSETGPSGNVRCFHVSIVVASILKRRSEYPARLSVTQKGVVRRAQ